MPSTPAHGLEPAPRTGRSATPSSRPSPRPPDALFGHDAEGRITVWNRSAERIFGYAGRDPRPAHPGAVPRAPPSRGCASSTRRSWPATASIASRPSRAQDGMPVPISLSVRPVVDDDASDRWRGVGRAGHDRDAPGPSHPGRGGGAAAAAARRRPTSGGGCGTSAAAPCSGATSSIASTASIRWSSPARSRPTWPASTTTTAPACGPGWTPRWLGPAVRGRVPHRAAERRGALGLRAGRTDARARPAPSSGCAGIGQDVTTAPVTHDPRGA